MTTIESEAQQLYDGYAPGEDKPLASYGVLTVASHKAARLITKDKVTAAVRAPFTEYQGPGGPGEVEEAPRGDGLRHAIGELLVCPYCLGMWTSAFMTAGLLVAPRFTRW